ncbi:MAG: hypothetical protein Q8939_03730 [Bacteroidota bacterium]|nr:hypothetical protein [Bacteroidota bacterium]
MVSFISRQCYPFEITAIFASQLGSQRDRNTFVGFCFAIKRVCAHHLGQHPVVSVIMIETEFIPDPQSDQQNDGYPRGQANNIDETVNLAFQQMTPGDFEMIFYHTWHRLQENAIFSNL